MKRILIYGGGAVGQGIASCLLKSGEQVDVLAREDTVKDLRKGGLRRTGIFGEYYAEPTSFNCYSFLKDLPKAKYDYILICTKSYHTQDAARDLSRYPSLLANNTRIILVQNGWGNAEIFVSFFPRDRIYNARVITGFCRPQKNQVDITVHADAIHIGSLFNENAASIAALSRSISDGGIPCELTDEIGKDLWAKMLYNCALNPLGAIFDVPYGVLGECEYTRKIMNGIINEVFQVMLGSGYSTHWESAEGFIKAFYERLLPPTAGHESSMIQDIRLKKKTEIDFLNGAVVSLGKRINTDTPYNCLVYNMLKFLEAIKVRGM